MVLEALEAIAARDAYSLDAPVAPDTEDGSVTSHDVWGAEDERYALIDTTVFTLDRFEGAAID